MEHFRGHNLLGQHRYGESLIRINERLDDSQRWGTFIHELAHYRVRGHSLDFHEEMDMVYRRFGMWLDELTAPSIKTA
jgi:hypothetical protein